MVGQTRADVEKRNPGWKLHQEATDNAGNRLITYKDWHWSWSHGVAHGSEYHRVTYSPSGTIVAWSSNSNPTSATE